jgi:D-glycero-beta-D-manno-heptose-7-phosphate kinase
MKTLLSKVEKFAGKKILVIGDVILDRYVYGDVSRISPEAPVPVVKIEKEVVVVGGAANTANNISSLGAEAFLVGVVGNDPSKEILLRELDIRCINRSGIVIDSFVNTIEKTRVVGNSHQLVRIDYETVKKLSDETEEKLMSNIEKYMEKCDIIVVSDYGKGIVTENLMRKIKKLSNIQGKKIIVDPKPKNYEFYKDVFIITPNSKEAYEISKSQNTIEAGNILREKMNSHVLVTEGPKGMTLFELGKKEVYIPTKSTEVYDVSGAGDTVTATIALCIASGMELKDAAVVANYAAGIVVRKAGTATVSKEELKGAMRWEISDYLKESIRVKQSVIDGQLDKIEEVVKLMIDTYRNNKKILVFGNGGSASDAQHFVGELVGRFKFNRNALPAVALNTDTTVMTAIGNDFGYEMIFERQIEALANEGDLVIGISTSGNSKNVIRAMQKARSMKVKTVGLTGMTGGKLSEIADIMIIVPSDNTPRIQEAHIAIIHIMCELLEMDLFGKNEISI